MVKEHFLNKLVICHFYSIYKEKKRKVEKKRNREKKSWFVQLEMWARNSNFKIMIIFVFEIFDIQSFLMKKKCSSSFDGLNKKKSN